MQGKFTIVHKILSVFQSFPPKTSLSLPKTSDPLKKFPLLIRKTRPRGARWVSRGRELYLRAFPVASGAAAPSG